MTFFINILHSYPGSWSVRFYNWIFRKNRRGKYPHKLAFLVGGERYYHYDNYLDLSVNRRGQINALIREEVELNLTRPEAIRVNKSVRDYAEASYTLTSAVRMKAINLYNDPAAAVDPNLLRAGLRDIIQGLEDPLRMTKNIQMIQEEVAKRFEMLTLFRVYARVAALCVWRIGEDPREPMSAPDIEARADLFLKKKVLAPLLRLPIRDLFYRLKQSEEDTLQFLKAMILDHEAIASAQKLEKLGLSTEKTKEMQPAKA